MSDYRFQLIEHNGIPCLHVMIDAEPMAETHIPLYDIQAALHRPVQELLEQALSIDGAHHKQWYLWCIAEALKIELPDDIADKGIAP